ncbi:SLAM family member 5, partial [Antrostomus carolinensis]
VCAGDGTELIRAVGDSVTFLLDPRLDGEAAAWSFHDIIVTVKFGSPPEATFFDKSYKQRLTFPKNGRGLTISQLKIDDAGTYTANILGVKTSFTLRVYRKLMVPTVTCTAQNCSANSCLYTLHCTTTSGSGSGNISYSWSLGGWPLSEGPVVLVEESTPEQLLTCTVQNPVSSSNSTVRSPAALCAGSTPPVPS